MCRTASTASSNSSSDLHGQSVPPTIRDRPKEGSPNLPLFSSSTLRHSASRSPMSRLRPRGRNYLFIGRSLSLASWIRIGLFCALVVYGVVVLLFPIYGGPWEALQTDHDTLTFPIHIRNVDMFKDDSHSAKESVRKVIPMSSITWLTDGQADEEKDWKRILQFSISKLVPTENIVHIIYTSFESDGNLVKDLAKIELFKTFSCPTMVRQTKINYIWVIQLSELMDTSLYSIIQQALYNHPSAILLKPVPHSLQDGNKQIEFSILHSGRVLRHLKEDSSIFSGDLILWHKYLTQAESEGNIILETTLDFLAGLPREFVELLQNSVKSRFTLNNTTRTNGMNINSTWAYWCVDSKFEWYVDKSEKYGKLGFSKAACIVPGSTFGYMVGFDSSKLPRSRKDISKLFSCESPHETACADSIRELTFGAIQTRTPVNIGEDKADFINHTGEPELSKNQKKQKDHIKQLQWEGEKGDSCFEYFIISSCNFVFSSQCFVFSTLQAIRGPK